MGWVCLGTSATQQVNQGKISASCTPRSQEMLNSNCSLMTIYRGQTAWLPRSVKGTFAKWVPHREQHISNHKEPPYKTQTNLQGKNYHTKHMLGFIQYTFVSELSIVQSWSQKVSRRTDFAVFCPNFGSQFPCLQWPQLLFTLLWK